MKTKSFSVFFPERTVGLHAMFVNCGRQHVDSPSYRWDGLRRGTREMYIWQYTLAGCGAVRIGGKEHPLTPGKAFFVRVPGEHVYYFPSGGKPAYWEFIYVTLFGSEVCRLGAEIGERYGNVFELPENALSVKSAWEVFELLDKDSLGGKYRASAYAYSFITALLDDLESGKRRTPGSTLLDRVNAYLIEHISDPLSIGTLAAECGCSRSHFSRLFHATAGMSPRDYANDVRLKFAIRLLQTERLSVKEIAARVGFGEPSYFCRVFRKRFATSPEMFRSGTAGGIPPAPFTDIFR